MAASVKGHPSYPHLAASQEPGYPGALSSGLAGGVGGPAYAPLRAIHVGPCLVRGGAEQWLLDLHRFLDPARVRLQRAVVTKPDAVDPAFVAGLDVPIETGQAETVRRAAKECDVLLCWGVELNDWLEGCRPPLCVYVAHGEGDWTREQLRQSDRVVDHVVAVSRAVRQRTCDGLPTSVIFNGVDSARLARSRSRRAVREALGFQPSDFVVGYVGRFSPEKRAHVVIDAVSLLPTHFKALLVGWGAQRLALLEAANERIAGRYAFATAWDYLGDYYQAMDAVCLVSDQEGFPLVMVEAMMCGRPLIATPVGGMPEVIQDRVNAVLVPGDATSLAAAAEMLWRNPEWARGIAAAGQAFAEEHGHARRMAREYEDLLHRLWRDKNGNGHANGNGNGLASRQVFAGQDHPRAVADGQRQMLYQA
jgi:glycosyltransferase involved in cell wall biosynthesis